MIAVSKLCCPTCYELLSYLSVSVDQGHQNYRVRGRHSTLHPVVLPPLLDLVYVRKLVAFLEQLVYKELIQLNLPSGKRPSKHKSPNDSIESTASDASFNSAATSIQSPGPILRILDDTVTSTAGDNDVV